jgi:hypothetical protein
MFYDLNCSGSLADVCSLRFRGEDVCKPVGALSAETEPGSLCMLMDARINFLILDEPNNHMDLTCAMDRGAVADYGGTRLSFPRPHLSAALPPALDAEGRGIEDFDWRL